MTDIRDLAEMSTRDPVTGEPLEPDALAHFYVADCARVVAEIDSLRALVKNMRHNQTYLEY